MKFRTKSYILLLFLVFVGFSTNVVLAQKDAKKRGPEYYEKKKEKDKEKTKDGQEEAKQRHLDIQSKETRKRMKRTRKKSEKQKKGRGKSSFFRNVFRKNR